MIKEIALKTEQVATRLFNATVSKETMAHERLLINHVAITFNGAVLAGSVTIRARPLGQQGYTKINIEGVNLATATTLSWIVEGLFDAWAVTCSGITPSTSINVVVSSIEHAPP